MLMGFTAVGGDEPLGGFGVPTRPDTLLNVNRVFGLNVPLMAADCSLNLDGDLADIASPITNDEFGRNREFVTALLQGRDIQCGLSLELVQECFPDDSYVAVPAPNPPQIDLPRSVRLNAEFGIFGVAVPTPPLVLRYSTGDTGYVTVMVVDVIYT